MKHELTIINKILLSKILQKPYKLNFAITSMCNSRCTNCNILQVYRKNPEIVRNELKIDEIDRIFKNLPSTVSGLSFTGGSHS